MKNNETLSYRVTKLEEQCEKMENRLEIIMENHLPHINETLASLKTRITVLTAVNIGALITALLVSKFFG